MTLYDYETALTLRARHLDIPFYSLIMAAMMQADSSNLEVLKCAFPEVWDEVSFRYNAPGGLLDGEAKDEH